MRKWMKAALIGLALIGTKAVADDATVLDQTNGFEASSGMFGGLPTEVLAFFSALTAGFITWAYHDNGGKPTSP